MNLLLIVLFFVVLYTLPLLKHRIKTKRVILKYIKKNGQVNETILYLKNDDPLWDAIKSHKESLHAK